jgi:hypothetical protein
LEVSKGVRNGKGLQVASQVPENISVTTDTGWRFEAFQAAAVTVTI